MIEFFLQFTISGNVRCNCVTLIYHSKQWCTAIYSGTQKCTLFNDSVQVCATVNCVALLMTNHSAVVEVCGSPSEKIKANSEIAGIVINLPLNLLNSATTNDLAKQA